MITVNGTEMKLTKELTLSDFLKQEKYQTSRIAVELNGAIISKSQYSSYILQDDDVLEVVSFVGGG